MSDDFAEPTLLRRNSSTTYKEAFEVIKPYDKNHSDYLCLNVGDIVIVKTDCSVAGSSLRYGYKVPYNHQNGSGWFDESCLRKCNIPIEELTGPRYLISSTPLRSTADLSSSASITSSITSNISNRLVPGTPAFLTHIHHLMGLHIAAVNNNNNNSGNNDNSNNTNKNLVNSNDHRKRKRACTVGIFTKETGNSNK